MARLKRELRNKSIYVPGSIGATVYCNKNAAGYGFTLRNQNSKRETGNYSRKVLSLISKGNFDSTLYGVKHYTCKVKVYCHCCGFYNDKLILNDRGKRKLEAMRRIRIGS